MATLLTLRRRIKASQNVSKTTRAMQMIAASKLKKAQDATLASRPYVQKLTTLATDLSHKVEDKKMHPYITSPANNNKTLVIALSPDKGLCGGLVTNLVKEFFQFAHANKDASYIVIGKKLEGQVVKLNTEVIATFVFGTTLPKFEMVFPIAKLINDEYLSGNVSNVKIIYTDFNSIFSQTPKIANLLPIALPEISDKNVSEDAFQLYEPKISEILPGLLTHYLEMSLYQYLLESFLSEQASRMIAMQNATTNAKDIIEALRLEYNKTRQAKITSELLDIAGTKSVGA